MREELRCGAAAAAVWGRYAEAGRGKEAKEGKERQDSEALRISEQKKLNPVIIFVAQKRY